MEESILQTAWKGGGVSMAVPPNHSQKGVIMKKEDLALLRDIMGRYNEDGTEKKKAKKEEKPTKTEKEPQGGAELEALQKRFDSLEKELKAEKAKNAKSQGVLAKVKGLFSSQGVSEDGAEEPTKEPTKEPTTGKGTGNTAQNDERFERLEAELYNQKMERIMDQLEIPQVAKARSLFMMLLDQKADEKEDGRVSAKDLQEAAKDVHKVMGTEQSQSKGKEEEKGEEEEEGEEEEVAKKEEDVQSTKATGKRLKNRTKIVDHTSEEAGLKEFRNMGSGKRQLLFEKNPDLYHRLEKASQEADGWVVKEMGRPYII